jgi:hypothetical protein
MNNLGASYCGPVLKFCYNSVGEVETTQANPEWKAFSGIGFIPIPTGYKNC